MKIVYLALSVPNRHGQKIFATFDDRDGKERYWIFKPTKREHWKESEVQKALTDISQDLSREGYSIQVVTIQEYNGIR